MRPIGSTAQEAHQGGGGHDGLKCLPCDILQQDGRDALLAQAQHLRPTPTDLEMLVRNRAFDRKTVEQVDYFADRSRRSDGLAAKRMQIPAQTLAGGLSRSGSQDALAHDYGHLE